MKHYGIELEYFVNNKDGNVVPAYKYTKNVDGNPLIGELRTGIHPNIINCVHELKKLLYIEDRDLTAKRASISMVPTIKVEESFIKALRADSSYVEGKMMEILQEKSIYDRRTSKVLPRLVFKASLQVNISDNEEVIHHYINKLDVPQVFKKWVAMPFDYYSIIRKLDERFKEDIIATDRVAGVYAMKQGVMGKRIEYRSLPNDIDPMLLIDVLEPMKKQLEEA